MTVCTKQTIINNEDGFSLVEVVVVLVILVIIASVAISRTSNLSTELITQTEVLKAHIRYAQTLAMSHNDPSDVFGIKCDTLFYWLFKGSDPDSNLAALPDDKSFETNSDNKLDLAGKGIDANAFTLFFDSRGIPYSSYVDAINNTPLTSDLSIAITPRSEAAPIQTIIVTQLTGFIP